MRLGGVEVPCASGAPSARPEFGRLLRRPVALLDREPQRTPVELPGFLVPLGEQGDPAEARELT